MVGGDIMSNFTPEKLSVEFRNGMTPTGPLLPRHYTLTHSDTTAELFLTIGTHFAWDKVDTKIRDEVFGIWNIKGNQMFYDVYVYLDRGEYDLATVKKRNEIFRRELPLALTAIRYGDRMLFCKYPSLDYAVITVHFTSNYPPFSTQENWGNFINYSI